MAKVIESLRNLVKSYKKRAKPVSDSQKNMYRVAQAAKNAAKIAESEKAR